MGAVFHVEWYGFQDTLNRRNRQVFRVETPCSSWLFFFFFAGTQLLRISKSGPVTFLLSYLRSRNRSPEFNSDKNLEASAVARFIGMACVRLWPLK